MNTQETILEFNHVTLERRDFSINDATFSIRKGYITVLMGDNGARKTTLLSMLINAELLAGFYSNWDGEYFKDMMRRMNVSMGTSLRKLSRGNYIRFQFAWAMAHHPWIYVMDEPTAGMDPVFRMECIEAALPTLIMLVVYGFELFELYRFSKKLNRSCNRRKQR